MAITRQAVLAGSKRASFGLQNQRRRQITISVTSKNPLETEKTVVTSIRDDNGPISYGVTYAWDGEKDDACLLEKVEPRQVDGQNTAWHVDLTYAVFPDAHEKTINPWINSWDPFLRPPDIQVVFEPRQEAVKRASLLGTIAVADATNPAVVPTAAGLNSDQQDVNWSALTAGQQKCRPVVNSFGELLVSGQQRNRYRMVLTYALNVGGFPAELIDSFQEAVNSAAWAGGKAGTWFCRSITAPFVAETPSGQWSQANNGLGYFRCTAVVVYDPQGWWVDLLDEGLNQWSTDATPKRQPIVTSGIAFGKPAPLDGHGRLLTDAAMKSGSYKFLRYLLAEKLADFNDLISGQYILDFLNTEAAPADLNPTQAVAGGGGPGWFAT